MLVTDLDKQTEIYLADLLAAENTTSTELLKTLIRDRWLSLQSEQASRSRQHKEVIATYIRRKSYR
ncbi:hypothetical protein IQ268_06595 [Oculatella sp. LEGE 06141]|uniref:hypothetical protein n=1 Tax=Oculatella sp. LEGE 06141 TaxID=1828648 RepID=UPI001881DF7F|nr:hypothetical protein [Oculatella sp. LEGE 06141]MBE9178253.1 hypothetical protein [Oculatella sp. LEGE 06141]